MDGPRSTHLAANSNGQATRTTPTPSFAQTRPRAGDGRSPQRQREVVVVTGASAGVGRAVARLFGEHGARVGLIARGRDGLEGACRDVESCGGEALAYAADVSDPQHVEAAAQEIERQFGPIDIWVNDAMTSVFSPVKEMTPDEFRRVTEVTYLGYVYGTMAALRRMLPRDHGTIVQVGSALAYRGIPLQAAYCGSKHAIQGFTESLRCELYHDKSKVWVTMVQMPALNTPQFGWVKSKMPRKAQPVPPIYQPEVAARAVYWAAHHRRREINVGMSTLLTVLANKFASGLLDHYLGRTGYTSQQTSEPEDPERPSNLWQPVAGDRGAHGAFDDRAHESAPELWAAMHPLPTAVAAAGVAGATAFGVRRLARRAERDGAGARGR
ncbi:MAG: SDR family oxidoreductase [Dehalococcoidia bacterium]|nr:SDR family oxidoreductase [Dehalococcoidia bacterium]